MKILLLAITIILLLLRIKNTPQMVSKTVFKTKSQKTIDGFKENELFKEENRDKYKDVISIIKYIAIIFTLIFVGLIIIYYILVGYKTNTDFMTILSALQIVTMFISTGMAVKDIDTLYSTNIDDYKFHRLYFLFNVILDYIYYPLTIYMLLK